MNWITIIGLLAALGTTTSFLPQLIKSWKTHKTHDVSLPMYIVLCTSVFLWLIYGILIRDLPLILANVVTFILATSILLLKIKYR